jgi:hypothetical protein
MFDEPYPPVTIGPMVMVAPLGKTASIVRTDWEPV